MLTNDQTCLWSEIIKKSSRSTPALKIDFLSDIGIVNSFASSYETLFISVYNSILTVHSFSIEDIRASVKSLRAYIADGVD